MRPTDRVFVALDMPEIEGAKAMAAQVAGLVGGVKLGLEFFMAQGPAGIRDVIAAGDLPLFLDLKLHDIPNTVAGAVRSVAPLAPKFLTIHAGGGPAMIRAAADAAREEAERLGVPRMRILAVTVLTSLSDEDLAAVGQAVPAADQVRRLAQVAHANGADGIVCSPAEVALLRRDLPADFTLMVPGIRPTWAAANDQKRVMGPRDAVAAGADHLVIGRPITADADPAAAARRIAEELGA
ncbi:orotidine-5'-phosphate decarboxylase [Niveispirillum cyanobacteriorum]|uniref:Orotidine 5'-phosphate decarboxylase n=1 Tax=Niveispirillum cyanobacteriorum TaxID=1612173 RepID=A0A2K9NEQ6_9PROT|nr:orotidine-5'-phosphate decarboxylase [Niveispirillum cyanobacteriorum]AUN30665.1 orotidine-5'-phosphate decarboxylase [Niveispirillum cyanobacteriorum]GGE52480.1 orotidine 5'-phosphate decarboxylase [Niveispirillum cyanobacteriorum]